MDRYFWMFVIFFSLIGFHQKREITISHNVSMPKFERYISNDYYLKTWNDIKTEYYSGTPSKQWKVIISYLKERINGMTLRQKLMTVNTFFNLYVYETETTPYDDFKTPDRFVYDLRGDCEDFAIAKYFALKELGVTNQMFITAILFKNKGGGHAILTVKDDETNQFFYLDLGDDAKSFDYISKYSENRNDSFEYMFLLDDTNNILINKLSEYYAEK